MTDTAPPVPGDDRDWSLVLEQGCPDCGHGADEPGTTTAHLAEAVARWQQVLDRPDATVRPSPQVWSPVEYACHTRDMVRLLATRVDSMLTHEDPEFADWDGDQKALQLGYFTADPAQVAIDYAASTEQALNVVERVGGDDWQRPGHRSDGKSFTVATMCQFIVHEVEHHLMDVRG